jgi:hypothetical protein
MGKKWQQALFHLEGIIGDCQMHQVPVGFILIPDEFQVNLSVLNLALEGANLNTQDVDLDLPQRRLQKFCEGRNMPCLDLLRFFRDVPETYAPHDTHWNVRGNQLAAEKIYHWLKPLKGCSWASFDSITPMHDLVRQ